MLSLSLSLSLSNTSTFPETSPCTRHLALKCSLSRLINLIAQTLYQFHHFFYFVIKILFAHQFHLLVEEVNSTSPILSEINV